MLLHISLSATTCLGIPHLPGIFYSHNTGYMKKAIITQLQHQMVELCTNLEISIVKMLAKSPAGCKFERGFFSCSGCACFSYCNGVLRNGIFG